MRKIILLLSGAFLLGFGSCASDYKKASETEINQETVQMVEQFATDYLTKLKNGEHYEFQDEATEQLKNGLSKEVQMGSYKQVQEAYGDFESLEFIEMRVQEKEPIMNIYRLKGKFGSGKNLEVRVVLNEEQKISGFWIREWSDMFY